MMGSQINAELIPKEVRMIEGVGGTCYYSALLEYLNNATTGTKLVTLFSDCNLSLIQTEALKMIPAAFEHNKTVEKFILREVLLKHKLAEEAIKAGLVQNNITCVELIRCEQENLRETICQAFYERKSTLQLEISSCDPKFVTPIIEAGFSKLFSLSIFNLRCSNLERPLRQLFVRGRLYYLTLGKVEGLDDNVFLEFARCVAMLPRIAKIDLRNTPMSAKALKRLYGSLKSILNPGRSEMFKVLCLNQTPVDAHLAYCFFTLLRSDLIDTFHVRILHDVMPQVIVKSLCSTVANTTNLETVGTSMWLTLGTSFEHFSMQKIARSFSRPFQVNTRKL